MLLRAQREEHHLPRKGGTAVVTYAQSFEGLLEKGKDPTPHRTFATK